MSSPRENLLADVDIANNVPISKKELYLPNLISLMLSLTYCGITTPFLQKDLAWWHNPFVGTMALSSVSFFTKTAACGAQRNSFLFRYTQFIDTLVYASIDLATRSTLFHELGHVLAGLTLLNNARPTVEIMPFSTSMGGFTLFNPNATLNNLGSKLGHDVSSSLISTAGPSVDIFSVYAIMIAAYKIPKNLSHLKMYLHVLSITILINALAYALLSIHDNEHNSDFTAMKALGITPLMSIGFITVSTLVLHLTLYFTTHSACKTRRDISIDKIKDVELDEMPLLSPASP